MFRFTIRELVLLTIIVAMGMGWWLEHRQVDPLDRRCNRLQQLVVYSVDMLREMGVDARYKDDDIEIHGSYWPPSRAPWVRYADGVQPTIDKLKLEPVKQSSDEEAAGKAQSVLPDEN